MAESQVLPRSSPSEVRSPIEALPGAARVFLAVQKEAAYGCRRPVPRSAYDSTPRTPLLPPVWQPAVSDVWHYYATGDLSPLRSDQLRASLRAHAQFGQQSLGKAEGALGFGHQRFSGAGIEQRSNVAQPRRSADDPNAALVLQPARKRGVGCRVGNRREDNSGSRGERALDHTRIRPVTVLRVAAVALCEVNQVDVQLDNREWNLCPAANAGGRAANAPIA